MFFLWLLSIKYRMEIANLLANAPYDDIINELPLKSIWVLERSTVCEFLTVQLN